LSNAYTVFVYLGFIAVLVIFGLPEVPLLREKLHDALNAVDRGEMVAAADEIRSKIRQYVVVTTLTSVVTGAASTLLAFVLGVDLAVVWGILNFLLNFIPFVAKVISVVLVTVYAMVQFGSLTSSLVVFFSFAVLQIAIGSFILFCKGVVSRFRHWDHYSTRFLELALGNCRRINRDTAYSGPCHRVRALYPNYMDCSVAFDNTRRA
jgi:hypothetical protein